ncbi:hypothetical protein BJX96DRAFT_179665 [Aspergillus floccosus]
MDIDNGVSASTEPCRNLCKTSIDLATSVGVLEDIEQWKICPLSEHHQGSFNTGIFLRSKNLEMSEIFDVNLVAQPKGSQFTLELVYRRNHLSPFYAQHLMSAVSSAIHIVASREPKRSLSDINLCTPSQQKQVLYWQNSRPKEGPSQAMFQIVEELAIRQPSAQAVQSSMGTLTYLELDNLSSRLAIHLQARYNITPGAMIMLCAIKDVWAIVAMLAINKTGACFVPCDANHPVSRRQTIVGKCQSQLALVSPEHETLFSGIVRDSYVISKKTVTNLPQATRDNPTGQERFPVSSGAPAYCFFTSGSLGEPKGCLGTHSALAAVAHQVSALCMDTESRVLQFAKFGFGISFIEIFCTLAAGGTVCIASEHERLNALSAAIRRMKVNWALITPTLAQSLSPEEIPTLKKLFLGGEAPNDDLISRWQTRASLYQVFGTTEMAGVTMVSSEITSTGHRKTVGFPANSRIWLAESTGRGSNDIRLAPIGAVAELLIEGPSLAEGYLGDPVRTQASFISLPPWLPDGCSGSTRLYKTGDLVRYNEDGSLSYIGRMGTQVKLRGQRIELEEVECHLVRLLPRTESFSEAQRVIALVIDPREDAKKRTLAAFVLLPLKANSPRNGDTGRLEFVKSDTAHLYEELEGIRERLQEKLPSFMVPQLLFALTDVPRTATGKIDRIGLQRQVNALPYEELRRLAGRRAEMQAPSTEIERQIHDIVCEVLAAKGDQVSMRDDFFHMGGNSMTAIKLAAAAKRISLKLVVADIFKHSVLADMAKVALKSSKDMHAPTNVHGAPTSTGVERFKLLPEYSVTREDINEAVATQCGISDSSLVVDAYPCSPLQEGMVSLTEKNATMYRARVACNLHSGIHIDRFQAAWQRVVENNEILRTRLVSVSSKGMWQVVISESFEWDHAGSRAESESMGLGTRLVRAIIKTNTEGAVFNLTIHHVLCDLWTIRLLLDQLWSSYGFATDEAVGPSYYRPFIEYVKERSRDPASASYWKQRFSSLEAEAFPRLPQPDLAPSPDEKTTCHINLPSRVTGSVTVATYLRLAWAMVVSHHTALDDVVFGETLNGRSGRLQEQCDESLERIVGPAIVTVPQRVLLDPERSVAETLALIQEQQIRMIPFEQLGLQHIRRLGPEAESACMFQSHLVFQPAWKPPRELFRSVDAGSSEIGGFSSYALGLECGLSEDENEVDITAYFDSRVVSLAQATRLLNHLEMVLQSLVQEPYQSIQSVPHITPKELDQIHTWNATVPDGLKECAHEAIRKQSEEAPSAPAICAWDGELTYKELENYSNQIALAIVDRGISRESLIPLLFEKSMWMTVAMVGVNKAGGAFVPMDAAQPLPRLRVIAELIDCTMILCSEPNFELAKQVAPKATILAVSGSSVEDPIPQERNRGLMDLKRLPKVQPHDLMYAVFTSGSTGTPKGVLIEHGSYCTAARECSSAHEIDKQSRMLQFASYSFDAFLAESLNTLVVGGCVCVPSEKDRQNGLAKSVREMQVTHAMLTPAISRLFRHEDVPSLRSLILMGEAMRPADFVYWGNQVQLFNGYGPTECTIALSCREYRAGVHLNDIGWPRAAAAWIIDPRNPDRLMPIGAVGELVIEGPPVARGYLKSREQTSKAFLSPPSWRPQTHRPHRMYRTGDLVCYTDDRSLRIVGRMNDQIKLRSQRLERGEVESRLRQFWQPPGVEVAVDVIVPASDADRVSLAVFIVQDPSEHNNGQQNGSHGAVCQSLCAHPTAEFSRVASQVEAQLQQELPRFMVPSIFVPVRSMPHMPSGKIDRPRLKRELETSPWEELRRYLPTAAPSRLATTNAERTLQEIWAQVLQLPSNKVGIDDNFFHLGGDSVNGMQAVVQARARNIHHTLEEIFRWKTIAAILSHSSGREHQEKSPRHHGSNLTNINNHLETFRETLKRAGLPFEGVEDIYPCGPIQQNILLVHCRRPAFYHVAFTWEVQDATVDMVLRAVKQLIARHSIFRTRFLEPDIVNGSFLQVVLGQGQQNIPVKSLSEGITDFPGDFQPTARCPSQFTIYHRDWRSVHVRLDITHALWDGGPATVVERELGLASQGKQLPPHPPLYCNYIAYVQSQDLVAGKAFWSSHIRDTSPCHFPSLRATRMYEPDIPQDLHFELDQHAEIGPFCRRHNVTAPNLFCLAWGLVLRAVTSMDEVCFGNLVSGRDLPLDGALEMAGPLINLLPCRINLRWGTAIETLQRVYHDYAACLAHQTFPIANLPHSSGRSALTLFNTQLSIRRTTTASQSGKEAAKVCLRAIQSWDPHECRVNVYVIMEESRTRVEMRYWKSTMSPAQAALIERCFYTAVSQILAHGDAPLTELSLLLPEDQQRVWEPSLSAAVARLRELWAKVLGIPHHLIGGEDDFFHLGGNSVRALQVTGLAREAGIDLRVADVFTASTLLYQRDLGWPHLRQTLFGDRDALSDHVISVVCCHRPYDPETHELRLESVLQRAMGMQYPVTINVISDEKALDIILRPSSVIRSNGVYSRMVHVG